MKLKSPKSVLPQLDLEVENTNPIVDGVELGEEDDTVFYFTNASNEDWSTQWNKIIYTFPAQRRTRMSIKGATPEEVQNIRKMFAERYANEQFFKTKEFAKRNTPTEGQRPVTYAKSTLQPWIDSCLKPLPKGKLESVEAAPSVEDKFSGNTRPLKGKDPMSEFKDDPYPELGQMSGE